MPRSAKVLIAVLSAFVVLLSSGCSGDATGDGQATERTATDRLAAARAALDATPTVHLTLTGESLPKSGTVLVSAEGWGVHPPGFQGDFKLTMAGVPATAAITAVGGEVWAKLPLVPGTNKINPASLGLPDPASLFAPEVGLTSLLTAVKDPVIGEQTRHGSDVLTSITGSLAGTTVNGLFKFGDAAGSFTAAFGLTDGDQLRTVTVTGPFYAGATVTYTLVLDKYGVPFTITTP